VDARVEVNGAPQVGEEALRFMKTIADIYIAGARTTDDWKPFNSLQGATRRYGRRRSRSIFRGGSQPDSYILGIATLLPFSK
jgi:hypothetical protein